MVPLRRPASRTIALVSLDLLAERWRSPATWSALSVARYIELPGLLVPSAAIAIRDAARALGVVRLATDLVQADRHLLAANELTPWLDLLQSDAFRELVTLALGRAMPRGLVVNAWRMNRGDRMGVHPDGPLYRGTISLGLCDTWSEDDGGAIAFGDKDGDSFTPTQRWYPRLGDALLFAPTKDSWHCVEPVRGETTRYSLTGWWTELADGLTRGRD